MKKSHVTIKKIMKFMKQQGMRYGASKSLLTALEQAHRFPSTLKTLSWEDVRKELRGDINDPA
jgi:hypothetical protein